MKFHRLQIAPLAAESLRAAGSSAGWLLEDLNAIRVGLGGSAVTIELNPTVAVEEILQSHQLDGDEGPSDSGLVAFGSLPFDRSAQGWLAVPEVVVTQYRDGKTFVTTAEGSRGLVALLDDITWEDQDQQNLRSVVFQPTAEEYAHNVTSAVDILRTGALQKVVLARSVKGTVPTPIDTGSLANRLRKREPACTIYSIPLQQQRRYVGASPELLVQRFGAQVACNPLAGTTALPANITSDDYSNWLLGSGKNLHEHKLLVDEVEQVLQEYFNDVKKDQQPSILRLRTVAHLSSWVKAETPRSTNPSVMTLLRSLHPTAAVCGIPRSVAYELLTKLEQHDRGHYAGPVGWVDSEGNGQWWVGIRGVMTHGSEFEAWAGAGIVSESDPIAEREETKDKLASVLTSILIDRV